VLIGTTAKEELDTRCNNQSIQGYTLSTRLVNSSCERVIELYNRGVIDHYLADGRSFSSVLRKHGVWGKIGENLAKDFTSLERVMTAWHNSPTHEAILQDRDFNNYGLSEYNGYYVLHLSN